MKTFTTVTLTCCFIVVIALQAIALRNQSYRTSAIHYRPADRAVPQIETVSYSVEEGAATVAETAAAESPDTNAVPTLTVADSEPAPANASEEPAPIPANPFADAAMDFEPPPAESTVGSDINLLASEPATAKSPFSPARNRTVAPLSADLPETGPSVSDAPAGENGFDPFGEAGSEAPVPARKTQQKEQKQPDPELAKYPIWLLIKPDGVQFLQTEEEIATHFHTIPPHAFLIGCQSATFEAGAVQEKEEEGKPGGDVRPRTFQLSCEDFKLGGSYGTKQTLAVTGETLSYSTESQQVELKGSEERPLEFHSWDDSAENRMTADEIVLRLEEDGFQLSAKGASGIEIHPIPDPKKQSNPTAKPGGFEQSPRSTFQSGNNPFG